MIDPISDMLTRIRNAQKAGKLDVSMPFSNLKNSIAEILKKNGYIENYAKEGEKVKSSIKIRLKYEKTSLNRKSPAITEIYRVSRQGRRVYTGKEQIRKIKQGYGLSIISTSKGVMTGEEARKSGVGGEIICEVW